VFGDLRSSEMPLLDGSPVPHLRRACHPGDYHLTILSSDTETAQIADEYSRSRLAVPVLYS
jgi:hypothetical protein